MFTKEQLAKWRSEGFVFDNFYDEVAIDQVSNDADEKTTQEEEIEKDSLFFDSFTSSINEDAEDRYIRKVLHMIKNLKIWGRKSLNISMSTNIFKATDLNLNGHIIKRITLETSPQNQRNIDVTKIVDVPSITNTYSGITYTGIKIDKKIGIYVTSASDKKAILEYINGRGTDDFIPAFSKFNLESVQSGISQRQRSPYKIDQSGTSLCGLACICYLMAKYQSYDYKFFIRDLFYYAEAFYSRSLYLIKPRNVFPFGQVYDMDPVSTNYPKTGASQNPANKMSQCDYISLTSIKSSENDNIPYEGRENRFDDINFEGLGGMTMSGEISKLLKLMLLASDVVDCSSILKINFNSYQTFAQMNIDSLQGYSCCMLIKSVMLTAFSKWNKEDFEESEGKIPNHWVVYLGGLKQSAKGNFSFKVFSWGGIEDVIDLPQKQLEETFHGYVKAKL